MNTKFATGKVISRQEMGWKIKKLREKLRISQERLGEMVGVSYQQIQKYESGANKLSVEKLQIIARSLNIPVAYFFTEKEGLLERKSRLAVPYRPPGAPSREGQDLIESFRAIRSRTCRSCLLSLLKMILNKKKHG